MYLRYKNSDLYGYVYSGRKKAYFAVTHYLEKKMEGFNKEFDFYEKEIELTDPNIQDIYDVDFYVVYHDNSKSTENDDIELWNVNEGRCMHEAPDILKDEVGLILLHLSKSEDWVDCDRSSCSKIVKLEECEKYEVVYTYKVKNGEKLEEFIKESVEMTKEEFKNEMIKHRWTNM